MKTLLILGAGKEQVAAIAAAKTKGIRTVVLDMNPVADGRAQADEFHLVSTRDRDAILKFVAGYPNKIDGVMTIASDIPHMVAAAAEALGVRHIPLPVAELCVHKLHMKEKLREAGCGDREIESITGMSPTMVTRYSRFTNQRQLANFLFI